MKLLIINPNSDVAMTRAILSSATQFAGGEFDVDCLPTPSAPPFIDTYSDTASAMPGMVRLLRQHEAEYDGFVVACHCDPNLDLMKETTDKPMVGIGEASMKMATMLGHRFSVISTDPRSVPNKEALIRSYHLEGLLASVRYPAAASAARNEDERYLQTARAAVEEDFAEVIVLGCAGLTGLDKRLQSELGVPVLDGVICALIIAAGLVRYQVSTSKIRRYR
ncbi:MAG: Asp/Glu/hydantoin racemase [Actinomycetia bacterium]|nr:Asp/Glu/hydantoin racemase [Actinomycetes bacterium]MCP4962347.1 Asp/Glu/hydantoin racemase [Actinomycetes bacterium]